MAAEREWVVENLHPGIQRVTDRAVAAIFLWAFPRWIRPNHLTVLRFILIPVVIALLVAMFINSLVTNENWNWSLIGQYVFSTPVVKGVGVTLLLTVLSMAIGLPLADRRIAPNRWYGVRVRETFADEHIWYETNAQAGRDLVLLGLLFVVVALALAHVLPPAEYVMWCGPVFVLGALLTTVRSLRLARRFAIATAEFHEQVPVFSNDHPFLKISPAVICVPSSGFVSDK